jgi:hypothetical protein
MLEEHVLNMPNDLLMKLFHQVYLVGEQVEMVENVDFHIEMDLIDAKITNSFKQNEEKQ